MPTGRRQSRWLFKKRGEIDFGTIKEKPFSGSNPGPLAGYKVQCPNHLVILAYIGLIINYAQLT